MKNFLKGALLASSLLGAYAVTDEVMHPTTQVAEAATYWNNTISNSVYSIIPGSEIGLNEGIVPFGGYSANDLYYGKNSLNTVIVDNNYYSSLREAGIVIYAAYGSNYNNGMYYDGYLVGRRGSKMIVLHGDIYLDALGGESNGILNGYHGGVELSIDSYYSSKVNKIISNYNKPKLKPKASKTYSYKGQLTAKKSNYSLFANKQFSAKKGYTKAGRTYYAKGYFNYKGKRYYSLYQKDSKGKDVWRGYADGSALTKVKTSKINHKVMMTGKSYSRWKDLYFSRKTGTAKKGQVYYAKKSYKVGNGKTYYALYQDNSNGKATFKGYVDSKGLKKLNAYESGNQFVVKKGNYTRWNNLYFSQKCGKTSSYQGKIVTAKYGYKLSNGKTYYSLYDGKKWLGYVDKGALVYVKSKSMDKTMTMTGNKYTLWKNLAFTSKKGYAKKGQVYQAKHEYTLSGGKTYYSVYTRSSEAKWIWRGYVDAKGIKTLPSKEVKIPVTIKNSSAGRWNNLYFTNKRGKVSDYKGKEAEVRRVYTLGDGTQYYSVYIGKTWLGYMASNTVEVWIKTTIKDNQNFFFNTGTLITDTTKENIKNEVFKVKYKYTSGNKTYYQAYLGQVNGKPIKQIGFIQSNSCQQLTSKQYNKVIELPDDVTTYNQLYGIHQALIKRLNAGCRVNIKYYYNINGKQYVSLYEPESNEWLGYANADALKYKFELYNDNNHSLYVANPSSDLWDLDGNHESLSKEEVFYKKGYLTVNHQTYDVVYQLTADNDKKYYILKKNDLTELKPVNESSMKTLVHNVSTWNNLFFTQHKESFQFQQGVNFKTKEYYVLNGVKYYSVYQTDRNGYSVWCGYVNEDDMVNLDAHSVNASDSDVIVVKNGNLYKDHFFNKKGQLTIGQEMRATYYYTYGNGKHYISLYDSKTNEWLGYANAECVQSAKELKDALLKAKEATKKAENILQTAQATSDSKKKLQTEINKANALINSGSIRDLEEIKNIPQTLQHAIESLKGAATFTDIEQLSTLINDAMKDSKPEVDALAEAQKILALAKQGNATSEQVYQAYDKLEQALQNSVSK